MSYLNSLSKSKYPEAILGCPVTEEEKNEYENAPTTAAGDALLETFRTLRKAEAAKTPEPQVADSIAATLVQRGSRYGDFTDHAAICQELKDVMTGCTKVNPEYPDQRIHGWQLLSSVQRQALEVIVDKIARILSGDPNYDDNWHDIQGYAKLVEDRLPRKQTKETPNV